MVREETIKFISALTITYINFYKELSKEQYDMLIDLWHQNFEDIPYKIVMLAFNQYINSQDGKYPPVAWQLKEIIQRMDPQQEMSSNEAYALVYKAICNSSYYDNAVYEYNKLPKEIQKITSVDRLMQLARSENEASLVTFEASFKKDYKEVIKNKKEFEALPVKQQENVLKLQAMAKDLFESAVLGHKNIKQIESEN